MTQKRFPIVADDEVMLTEMPVMNLYDESDFISNIKGDYQDKNYLEWSPITEEKKQEKAKPLVKPIEKKEKSYAELAREEARADLKKKRTAPYLTADIASKSNRKKFTASFMPKGKPTAPFRKETPGELIKYGERLKQEQLILLEGAEEHPVQESHQKEKPQKNNYDFLKKSQIYNKDQQNIPTRLIKQELNVTNLD